MSPIKRVQVVVLLVVAIALLAGTPAHAAGKVKSPESKLYPELSSDEPRATATVVLGETVMWDAADFAAHMTVNCTKLRGGATYTVVGGVELKTFTADSRGTGSAVLLGWYYYIFPDPYLNPWYDPYHLPSYIQVFRDYGTASQTCVLEGYGPWLP